MTGTSLSLPRDARGRFALLALAVSFGFAGVYNGPLDELPLLLWCYGALLCWCWLVPPARSAPGPRGVLVAALALIWCAVAWRASVSPAISLAPTVSLAVIPLAAAAALGARDHAAAFATALLVSVALLVVGVLDLLLPAQRPRGLLDPNNLATLANLAWPPLLLALLAWRGARDGLALVLAALLLALVAFVIVTAGSRAGAAVALVLALLLLLLWRRRAPWLLGAAGVGALAGALLASLLTGAAATPEAAGDVARGVSIRGHLFAAAIELWSTAPITGTGPQTFSVLYPAVRDPAELRTAGYFAHNDWLQLAQELGLPALLLLLGLGARLVLVHLAGGLRAWRSGSAQGAEPAVLAAALLGVLAHALVNFTLHVAPIGLLFGLGLARLEWLHRARRDRPVDVGPDDVGPSATSRRIRLLALVLATALLGPLAIDAFSAAAFMGHRGLPIVERLDVPARVALARRLLAAAPDDSVPPLFLAEHHRRTALAATDDATRRYELALAIQYFELALARDELNTGVHRRYASLATAIGGEVPLPGGRRRSDEALLTAARQLQPQDPALVMALGRLHAERGAVDAERALLEDWLPWCFLVSRRSASEADVIRRRAEDLAVDPERLALCPASVTAP